METLNGKFDDKQNKPNGRPKSSTRFPKQMPSYIVAFAVQETYDDIATAQQMICNKRSLQSSAGSVSPTLSSKTITIDHNSVQKIPVIDVIEMNEVKNNVEEEDPVCDENGGIQYQNQLPETNDYLVVNNKEEEDVKQQDDNIKIIQHKQLKRQYNRLSKKKRQNYCRVKSINFKYKKLLKKEENINRKPACAAKIKETFYSNSVSKMVSPTSLLKSVAKVNILDTVDSIFSDEENNNESLHSSPSSTKKSFISYSSEDTLTRQGSTSSKNEDLQSINSISSVIRMPSQREIPYKTEVINVSVAVAYNPASNDSKRNIPSTEPYRSIFDRDLLSTETLVQPSHLLTSDSTSSGTSENPRQDMNNNSTSEGTLKPKVESDTTYVVGNTSSDAGDSMQSESTLAPNSETFMYAENLRQTPPPVVTHKNEKVCERTALLDKVINMGIFPEINPSTSSGANFRDELNSVFVTNDSGKFLKSSKYSGDVFSDKQLDHSKLDFFNTLKKSCDINKEVLPMKNFNLPNECAIKAIINETDKIETKFWTGDPGNHPANITELWDRLVLVVDCAVRRLENSLTEKIVNEIRKAMPVYEKVATRLKEDVFAVDVEKSQGDATLSNREMFVEKNESLQCSLIGNQAIDNLMLKLSVEGPQAPPIGGITKSFPKIKKPKIFRDYFEVLKPPTIESAIVEGKGDTITVSTTTPSEMEEIQASSSRVKGILSGPVMFLRENLLVITSVPSFFVMLLCVYGVVVLFIKPW